MSTHGQPIGMVETGRIHFDPSDELRNGLAPFIERPDRFTLMTTAFVENVRVPGVGFEDKKKANAIANFQSEHLRLIENHQVPVLPSIRQEFSATGALRFHLRLRPRAFDAEHFAGLALTDPQPKVRLPQFTTPFAPTDDQIDIFVPINPEHLKRLGEPVVKQAIADMKELMRPPGGGQASRFDATKLFVAGARLLFTTPIEAPVVRDLEGEEKAS